MKKSFLPFFTKGLIAFSFCAAVVGFVACGDDSSSGPSKNEETGIETGVVTSRSHFEFEYDKYLHEMVPYLGHIVCAEDTPHHKPHPEPLLRCIDLASAASGDTIIPEEVIFFGDTDHDFACARDAGCDFALADWKNRGWQDIPARYKFSGADEMEAILLRPSSAGL